jgi:hypothetical protein
VKKGYEKLQNFVLSQNKRGYGERNRSIEDQAILPTILATVQAHMLANIGKHLTCKTGRGKTERKSGKGTIIALLVDGGMGSCVREANDSYLSFFQFMTVGIEIEVQCKNNAFHIIFLFWSPVWSGVLMPESNHVAEFVHHNAKLVAVLS